MKTMFWHNIEWFKTKATMNQHPQVHHPLDAYYYLIVDELQLC
jgi:hypothetical protein